MLAILYLVICCMNSDRESLNLIRSDQSDRLPNNFPFRSNDDPSEILYKSRDSVDQSFTQ